MIRFLILIVLPIIFAKSHPKCAMVDLMRANECQQVNSTIHTIIKGEISAHQQSDKANRISSTSWSQKVSDKLHQLSDLCQLSLECTRALECHQIRIKFPRLEASCKIMNILAGSYGDCVRKFKSMTEQVKNHDEKPDCLKILYNAPKKMTDSEKCKLLEINRKCISEELGKFCGNDDADKFEQRIQEYCAGLSLISNGYLLVLIKYKSPSQLGYYKYLMMYIAIFEILYSAVDYFAKPIILSFKSTNIEFIDVKNSIFCRGFNVFLNELYSGFFGFSMAIFGINFIYRYAVTNSVIFKKYFNNRLIFGWFSIPAFYCLLWMLIVHFALGPWDQFTDFIREPVRQNFGINVDDVVYLGSYFLPVDEEGNQYLNYYSLTGILILTLMTANSMFCVFWFGGKCYRQIYKLAHVGNSEKTKRLQRQLLNALVVQTLIPVVLMYIPLSILFTAPYFETFNFGSSCINITIAIYPAIDAFPTMFIVTKYRNVTLSRVD
ncbi:unnamed protein product [Caenorhabditis bovis]|uniref:Seven TM Receptor n=1 Tax=Caenorhabditis bovis TaxID=2654633 RepID=A0A8S1EC78_9PELO|nr:unnamed protein product [Caenorhabditis bovis]